MSNGDGSDLTWQITTSTGAPWTLADHARYINSRIKSAFYPQPRAHVVLPSGERIPQPRVGSGWSRAGVHEAYLESMGPGYLDTARYVNSASAQARRAQILAERAKKLRAQERAQAIKHQLEQRRRRAAEEQRRRQAEHNLTVSRRNQALIAQAARDRAAAAATLIARRPVQAPPMSLAYNRPQPASQAYRTPTARGGLVTGSGSPFAAPAPRTLVDMPR